MYRRDKMMKGFMQNISFDKFGQGKIFRGPTLHGDILNPVIVIDSQKWQEIALIFNNIMDLVNNCSRTGLLEDLSDIISEAKRGMDIMEEKNG